MFSYCCTWVWLRKDQRGILEQWRESTEANANRYSWVWYAYDCWVEFGRREDFAVAELLVANSDLRNFAIHPLANEEQREIDLSRHLFDIWRQVVSIWHRTNYRRQRCFRSEQIETCNELAEWHTNSHRSFHSPMPRCNGDAAVNERRVLYSSVPNRDIWF